MSGTFGSGVLKFKAQISILIKRKSHVVLHLKNNLSVPSLTPY